MLTPLLVLAVMALLQVALGRPQLNSRSSTRLGKRYGSRASIVTRASARAAGRRVLPDARIEIAARPEVGEPITVGVSVHLVTDLPLVGPLFPDPDLRARAVMRVER